MAQSLIEVTDALFGYADRPVVRAEQLRTHAGCCIGIFGPNGAGKTTLVRGLTGLLTPLSGRVERAPGLRRVSYLAQHRAMELHWPMTALDAACLPTSAFARFGWIRHSARSVRPWMDRLGVAQLSRSLFAQLSGGQQQRVLLAGALAVEPQLLVLDEPTDGLDVASRRLLTDVLNEQKSGGLATVVISHDVADLLRLADEIACVTPAEQNGDASSVQTITPQELLDRMAAEGRSR